MDARNVVTAIRATVPTRRRTPPSPRSLTYRDALLRAGFAYRLQFQVVPGTGLPLYLVYGTGHEKGVEVMKQAMWEVDLSDGMSFRDPRARGAVDPNQPTLWGGAGAAESELVDLVAQRLHEGGTSVDELGTWLLRETARWRARDAKTAVRDLLNNGRARIETAGRLTKASVIRLR